MSNIDNLDLTALKHIITDRKSAFEFINECDPEYIGFKKD